MENFIQSEYLRHDSFAASKFAHLGKGLESFFAFDGLDFWKCLTAASSGASHSGTPSVCRQFLQTLHR